MLDEFLFASSMALEIVDYNTYTFKSGMAETHITSLIW